MSFIWPAALLSLLVLPVGAVLYTRIGRRRRARAGAVFGSLPLVSTGGRRERIRRRLPLVAVLGGFAVLGIALARPQSVVGLPRMEGTVILAFDVSGSMAATDFQPTRMEAAKAAARDFVARQPPGVLFGAVAFSDSGFSVQVPTRDQVAVLGAINRLAPERGTSLGQGILTSLNAIALADQPATNYYTNRSPDPSPLPSPVPAGTYAPAAIVLLSDGENTVNPEPLSVAEVAAERGIRIHTIGIGSPAGVVLDIDGFKIHSRLNEAMLQQIAETTGGSYYGAESQQDLQRIYDTLDTRLVVEAEPVEMTSIFVALGIVLLLLGSLSSLAWLGRLP